VFVGHTVGTNGYLDNVVKLVGVSADSITMDSFIPA
jgi:hypothetical protein